MAGSEMENAPCITQLTRSIVQYPCSQYIQIPLVLSTDKDIPHETIPSCGPEKVILNINIMLYVPIFSSQNYRKIIVVATILGQILT